MYALKTSKLRVCSNILRQERNRKVMREVRIIILEHILPTPEALIYNLAEAGADIHAIIAKPYFINAEVLQRLRNAGFYVLESSYGVTNKRRGWP